MKAPRTNQRPQLKAVPTQPAQVMPAQIVLDETDQMFLFLRRSLEDKNRIIAALRAELEVTQKQLQKLQPADVAAPAGAGKKA